MVDFALCKQQDRRRGWLSSWLEGVKLDLQRCNVIGLSEVLWLPSTVQGADAFATRDSEKCASQGWRIAGEPKVTGSKAKVAESGRLVAVASGPDHLDGQGTPTAYGI